MFIVVFIQCSFSHIHKMKIKTIANISYMSYKYHLNQPMQRIEPRLNLNIAKKPHLLNSLNRVSDHPLTRKYIDVPFND